MTEEEKIYQKLSEIEDVEVTQESPEQLEVFPTISFILENDVPDMTLDKEIGQEHITVKIDIWAKSSKDGNALFTQVEAKMLELDYLVSSNFNLTDPSGVFHKTTQFTY